MKPGSIVVYRMDPVGYGQGVVREVLGNGRLVVDFEMDGDHYSDSFHAQELILESDWQKAVA